MFDVYKGILYFLLFEIRQIDNLTDYMIYIYIYIYIYIHIHIHIYIYNIYIIYIYILYNYMHDIQRAQILQKQDGYNTYAIIARLSSKWLCGNSSTWAHYVCDVK